MSKNQQYRFSRQTHHFGRDDNISIWQRIHIDPWLMLLLLTVCFIGLAILYSASTQDVAMVTRQMVSYLIAFSVMIGMAQIPPGMYRDFTPFFYVIGLFSLILVDLIGEVRMGAQRWIAIPGFGSVQPSEFMKLGLPMMCAWYLSRRDLPPNLITVASTLAIIVVPVLLIAKEPDLGTSLLVAASGFFVLFLAGLPWWMIGSAIGLMIPLVWAGWMFFMHDYQKQRVLTLLNPEADMLGAGWNITQSKTAIGAGGLTGKGYLEGTQSHLHFLPEGHTDFIIAAFSEEFGLLGVSVLMFLYACILVRSLFIASVHVDTYGRLLAGAIGMSFFVYVFVNIGMVGGILPIVGVPLPLISYGGTAIITLMAGFGLLMSVYTHNTK
ncbi:rod shape-determining protein RodA [Psychrobacter sp. YP14]|uniref:Peptidoglycan glycosyltransferase MrdB n=3 Tax=Psychrobacter TaxID=497 RepID=A0A844M063_9GAMM|nr:MULTISPECIES: rod shape-determining protein RodA [Psychrobacter]AWT49515.1 rod shape-determining protein RodA [Psychrobacter sp. YP14]MUG32316.1 rod shape-determining protein RodA [Psychrobacter sanguinis]